MKSICLQFLAILCFACGAHAVFYANEGSRSVVQFDVDVLERYLSYGVKFSALSFPKWTKEQRKGWKPTPAGQKDETDGSYFFDASCQNTPAFEIARKAGLPCDNNDKCGFAISMIFAWGTLPGMDWVDDGIVFASCAVIKVPQSCFDEGDCDPSQVTLLSGDNITPMVKFIRKEGDVCEELTKHTTSLAQLKSGLAEYAKKSGRKISLPK